MGYQHVFEGARAHVADWPASHWHSEISSPRSSQALCVSVWGTLAGSRKRAAIITDIVAAAGTDVGPIAAPTVRCEAGADGGLAHLLNETGANATPTCVDALVTWAGGALTVESKLTEPSFGDCSQTHQRTDKPPGAPKGTRIALSPACNGTHGTGSDLKTGTRAPCRLRTWDGARAPRLYWDLAPELFQPDALLPDGRPCPFAGPSFQLMRNLETAYALAAPRSARPDRAKAPVVQRREWGMLVAHAACHPNAAAHRAELDAFRQLLLPDVRPRVGLVTYEQIAVILRTHKLGALADDVERRLVSAVP